MDVKIIKCLQDNYSYLLIDNSNKKACVIDQGEAETIINYIEENEINLKYILNTHHHIDHIGGNLILKEKYKSKIIGFEGDKKRLPKIEFAAELCHREFLGWLAARYSAVFLFHNNATDITFNWLVHIWRGIVTSNR